MSLCSPRLRRRPHLSSVDDGSDTRYSGVIGEGELDGRARDLVHFDEVQLVKGNAHGTKLDASRHAYHSDVVLRGE